MFLRLAWRNIWRNKRRTLITIASIFFAVFFAVLMRAIQYGSYESMINNAVSSFTGYIQIQDNKFWDEKTLDNSILYTKQLQNLENAHPKIKVAAPRIESFALASLEKKTKGAMVLGIDPEKDNLLSNIQSKLKKGAYLTPTDKAVLINSGFANKLKLSVGDTLVMIGMGYHGANAAGKYPIKGIVQMGSSEQPIIYLPLKEAQYFYNAEGRITSLSFALESAEDVPEITSKIKMTLGNTDDYRIMNWKEMLPDLLQAIKLDEVSNGIFIYILYMIIGFGIFGTVLMMTAERQKEFGMMLSLGMKRSTLQFITWLEVSLLSIVGIVCAWIISFPLVYAFHLNPIRLEGEMAKSYEMFGMEPIIPVGLDTSVFTSQGIIVLIITTIITIYPMILIKRLKLIQAIRM